MERTTTEGKIVYLGEQEFTGILKQLIYYFKFHNNNKLPKKIVIPLVKKVDGVTVELEKERKDAITSRKSNA